MMNNERIRFIDIEQLLEMKENNDPVTVVDVLQSDSYAKNHIPEAINLPVDSLKEKAADALPEKDSPVVVYCASYMCHASTEAARTLTDMGYTHVLDYKAGLKGWQNAGMPVASA